MLTSGWSHLSDFDLAKIHAERPYGRIDWVKDDRQGELVKRGIKIKPCAECGEMRLVHNHDYICVLCRKGYVPIT